MSVQHFLSLSHLGLTVLAKASFTQSLAVDKGPLATCVVFVVVGVLHFLPSSSPIQLPAMSLCLGRGLLHLVERLFETLLRFSVTFNVVYIY